MSVINLIDGESNNVDKWLESCETLRTFAEFRQIRAITETTCDKWRNFGPWGRKLFLQLAPFRIAKLVTQNTFQRGEKTLKVESSFYRWKFCHHILFRNQITPHPSFSFYHECFQTHIKHKIVVPAKSMSLRNRILRAGESLEVYIFNKCSFHSLLLQFQRKHHKCSVNIFLKYWESLNKALDVVLLWM